MAQVFKNVYFPDYPAESPQKRNLTLAFGSRDRELFGVVRSLSSHELRELMGHPTFASLQGAAHENGLAINTYCLQSLRKKVRNIGHSLIQAPLPGFNGILPLPIDPIQATFRGGRSEPLHGWYPFLEGYSPDFVEKILCEFAPNASRILDPFAGTGTTPITISRAGRHAFYCELNPLLQFLTEAKITALTINDKERRRIADLLDFNASKLGDLINSVNPDLNLDIAYHQIFGQSRFFDEATYDKVLRMRAVVDHINCSEPLVANFLSVAVVASLISASLLIRRGDVRYKTQSELERNRSALESEVHARLSLIAKDLRSLRACSNPPMLICEDARDIHKLPPLNVEALITSPPYLNGTNYFRNTKVELWFLRCLHSADDLTAFRYRAITAGINDVTVEKPNGHVNGNIEALVQKLEDSAYDQRIPRMVQNYFSDMKAIFGAINTHLTDNAKLLIDIGDSAYGGIHVPTHALLIELLAKEGFALARELTLRRRMSRGGFPLSQVLLVLERRKTLAHSRKKNDEPTRPLWFAAWNRFKRTLPHQQGEFSKRNWGHPLHSLCSYQGKMKPSLASYLVKTFVPQGGRMLDPFGGVGTIPFEGALRGIHTWMFEISPAAFYISSAKVQKPQAHACEEIIRSLDEFIRRSRPTAEEVKSAGAIKFNGLLPDYFHPDTFREILLARRYFMKFPAKTPSDSLVLASLLHILHGNRPYALSRRSHPITPFSPTGPTEYRPLIPHLRDKVQRCLVVAYPSEFVPGSVHFYDATSWWPQEIDSLDAIITSPPFFDSTRFYLANWMRLWFCGWGLDDFRNRPLGFVDERQKKSFAVYGPVFRQARERLRKD